MLKWNVMAWAFRGKTHDIFLVPALTRITRSPYIYSRSTHVDHLMIYLGFEVKPHTLHFRVNTSHMFSRTLLTVKSNGQVVCQPNPSRSSHGSWLIPASLWRASTALVTNTNNCSCHWPWPYGAVVSTWPAMSFCNKQCPWPYNGNHLTLECNKTYCQLQARHAIYIQFQRS